MPDVETAEFTQSEQQVAAVWTDAWNRGTLPLGGCVIDHLFLTEGLGLRVEALAVDAVFDILVAFDDLGLVLCQLLVLWCACVAIHVLSLGFGARHRVVELKVGGAVVKGLAVGCPPREHLKFGGVVFHDAHLIVLHIIKDKIAGCVLHLNLGLGLRVERLACAVGGVGDEGKGRVP